MEYPDASFMQPKPKPAWMGKKHLQHGELSLSLTAAKLTLGWVLAASSPQMGKHLGKVPVQQSCSACKEPCWCQSR